MYEHKIQIKTDQMWRMFDRMTFKYGNPIETRVKVIKVGKIEGLEGEGVEFHFTNSTENYCMNKDEFINTFEKVY